MDSGWFRSLIQSNLILTHSHSPLKYHAESPLLLMDKVKKELDRMESLGVISRIEEPTDWF